VRGDAARGSGHDGFGLGLAIASGIVAAHGGTLTLGDSDLGGLRVAITFPR
jgi:signal transduction histidine kinase